ncbi:MAG: hypothetical protein D6701_09275 [Gemmatimonadetes bacterium]|nr:MAG: hypothetical protein D6701_09275 [Gemmatimonadota bacterium]
MSRSAPGGAGGHGKHPGRAEELEASTPQERGPPNGEREAPRWMLVVLVAAPFVAVAALIALELWIRG